MAVTGREVEGLVLPPRPPIRDAGEAVGQELDKAAAALRLVHNVFVGDAAAMQVRVVGRGRGERVSKGEHGFRAARWFQGGPVFGHCRKPLLLCTCRTPMQDALRYRPQTSPAMQLGYAVRCDAPFSCCM